MSVNKVILTGRVSEYGCKISWKENGKPEVSFTLVCEEPGKDNHRFKTFIPIQVVGPKAEAVAEALEPHDMVLVDGKLSWKSGQTKDSGKLVVVSFDVQRLVPSRAFESAN